MASTISAALVRELRERTGAAMMECKKALVASKGDMQEAIKILRKKGQTKADGKSARIASEGLVVIALAKNGKSAAMLEVNTETDFVARNPDFIEFAELAVQAALKDKVNDVKALSALPLKGKETVEEVRQHLVVKIGENIQLRRITYMQSEHLIGHYVHGGRIGVLLEMLSDDKDLIKDMAMHIAAAKPQVVSRDDVSEEFVEKEREIYLAQAAESGKPPEIIQKMIEGQLNKVLDEISLLGQPFIKEPSMKVSQLLKNAEADVIRFIRFEVGEGIEKKKDNFVDEVMSQARGES